MLVETLSEIWPDPSTAPGGGLHEEFEDSTILVDAAECGSIFCSPINLNFTELIIF